MSRMLLLVPRMYTEEEFKGFVAVLPEDFKVRTHEFWSYVEEKLQGFAGKIQRVYRDDVWKGGEAAVAYMSFIDHKNSLIVKRLVEKGAVFEATEDAMLVGESKSWLEMVKQNPLDPVPLEFYEETIRERNDYVARRIDETLSDDETGILFMIPDREINVKEPVKVIKVCRFDPGDYLRSWQIQTRSNPKS
jgi:hypothetical protein